jgi:tetratricopeptide (TPR) repeat protein
MMPGITQSGLLDDAQRDLENGNAVGAQEKCLRVLTTAERHPRALCLLGQALFSQGRHEEAVRIFNTLTLMEPAVSEHWQNLAAALRPLKQYDLALAAFDRALRLAPPSAAVLYNLGVLQMERCDYNAAYLALRDAVRLAPTDATMRWGFAQCCYDIVNLEESLQALERWEQCTGLNVDITVRIVFLLVMMGEADVKDPAITRLLADPPRGGRAAVVFASLLERLHRLDEARAIIQSLDRDPGLDHDPDKLLVSAVLAERAGEREAAREHLLVALDHHTEFPHRHHLLYRLAKVEGSMGRHEEAYAAAAEAHRSQLAFIERSMGRTPQQESRILARAARGCEPQDVATWNMTDPPMQESPVFVVGFPRSGTTLLEQVLDAHPALKSMDEQPFILRAHKEMVDCGIRYPDQLGRLSPDDLEDLRARYWQRVRQKVTLAPGELLVDKNPLNLLVLPVIRRLFPAARIILLIRHPCDVLLSCYMQNFRAPELALLCRDLPTLAGAFDAAFEFWYSQAAILRPSSYELRYERLTADFSGEVAKLTDYLQLPQNDAMLAPAERARSKGFVSTPSYAQILEPVNSRSVGRWRHYRRHFDPVMPTLTPWLERWGYPAG